MKRTIQSLLGVTPRPDTPVETPTVLTPRVATPTVETPKVETPAVATPKDETPAAAASDDAQKMAERRAKIVAKAKKGVLKHVLTEGSNGVMAMADMHTYSEQRYFIAHRSFSDLMEVWTSEGLVTYDPESGAVTLTEAGRAFAER